MPAGSLTQNRATQSAWALLGCGCLSSNGHGGGLNRGALSRCLVSDIAIFSAAWIVYKTMISLLKMFLNDLLLYNTLMQPE